MNRLFVFIIIFLMFASCEKKPSFQQEIVDQAIENGKIANGSGWIIPGDYYAPIQQGSVLMKKGAENPAAPALLDFLKSAPALAIIKKYGYDLPK